MAAARVNRLGPGGLLLLGPIVALVVHHGAEVLSADACLDSGWVLRLRDPDLLADPSLSGKPLSQPTLA